MSRYRIELTTTKHIVDVALNMRVSDQAEIWAAAHSLPFDAIRRSVAVSTEPLTGLVDDVPICIFGVGTSTPVSLVGSPWLLGTPGIEQHAKVFLRMNKVWIDAIKTRYDLLSNWVDERNTDTIRWIRWLGFDVHEAKPYGAEQLPFHYFEMRNNNV